MRRHCLLFTDLVDSTRLVEALGDVQAARLMAQHDDHARALLVTHRGREIDRTDGFFLLFDHAADAAGYAMAYQAGLSLLGLSARVGLHAGTVELRQNDAAAVARGAKPFEVEGIAKPTAARIMSLAGGGQTLLSRDARDDLAAVLAAGTELRSHGHYRLKGVEQPAELFELGLCDVCVFTPPPDGDKAYRVLEVGDMWQPRRQIRHNLPTERDAFIGRGADLRALAQRLDDGAKLVTVLGTGGTGKTRLVRRYGAAWLGEWPGGVCFCDLSEARSLEGVSFAVGLALEVPLAGSDPAAQLGHAIAARGRFLLLLDNFEQVREHAAAMLGRWIDRASEAAFVVTSRERLHLAGETLLQLEPLPLDGDAIDLFIARARAHRADFDPGPKDRAAIAEAVRLLDGLPLAIELAAARIRVMSPSQLVMRLKDRFQVLGSVRSDSARQQTLKTAIDWSWQLLEPWEQEALAQCSVFEGGFTLEAAEAVIDLGAWPQAPLGMDVVQALVDKSLLRIMSSAQRYQLDEPYFGMYFSIHEFAAEKLSVNHAVGEPSSLAGAQQRHGSHFARLGSDEAVAALSVHGGMALRRALIADLDNLVAACARAIERGDQDQAVHLLRGSCEALALQGSFRMAVALGVQLMASGNLPASIESRARALLGLALVHTGRGPEAEPHYRQALAIASEAGDDRQVLDVLSLLVVADRQAGRVAQAADNCARALTLARSLGLRSSEAVILNEQASLASEQGRMGDSQADRQAALALWRALGNRRGEASAIANLASCDHQTGLTDAALVKYDEAVALARENGDKRTEVECLGNRGGLCLELGRFDEARASLEAALALHRELGERRLEGYTQFNLGLIHLEQGQVGRFVDLGAGALVIGREVADRRFEAIVLGALAVGLVQQRRYDAAEDHYDAALVIVRALGYRKLEGEVLCNRAGLYRLQGRLDDAAASLEQALIASRAADDRRIQGGILSERASLRIERGQLELASADVREGERLLREVGAKADLGKLLCLRGQLHLAQRERDDARASLHEASALADEMHAGADSELGQLISGLETAIAAGSG